MSRASFRPSRRAVLAAQMMVVTAGLRREAVAIVVVLLALIAAAAFGFMGGTPLLAEPSILLVAIPIALVVPISIWRDEQLFGRTHLWTLPVKRQWNATAKVVAGGIWLVAAMLLTLLFFALVAWTTGGQIGVTETRMIATPSDTANFVRLFWSTPWWEYVAPFTTVLILYVLASAIRVGLQHPVRWLIGAVFAFSVMIAVALSLASDNAFKDSIQILGRLWGSRFGPDNLLSGGSGAMAFEVEQGDDVPPLMMWMGMPKFAWWAEATLAWSAAAALAMWLALRRHHER